LLSPKLRSGGGNGALVLTGRLTGDLGILRIVLNRETVAAPV
jgi:hypothetical protein